MFGGYSQAPTPQPVPDPPKKTDQEIQAEAARARELEELRVAKRGSGSTRLSGRRASAMVDAGPTGPASMNATGRSSSFLFGY